MLIIIVPATTLSFGEEFRPVKLERYCYGYPQADTENDFQFDIKLSNEYHPQFFQLTEFRLMGLIQRHSASKPTLIFCSTQRGAQQTAQILANQYEAFRKANKSLPWPYVNEPPSGFLNTALTGTALKSMTTEVD